MGSRSKPIGVHGTDAETGRAKVAARQECPISQEYFEEGAKPITLDLGDGQTMVLEPKLFSTGSFGWHASQKITVMVGDERVTVVANLLFTVMHSKKAPKI